MIEFATIPDPIFLAILNEALEHTRNDLYPFLATAQPSHDALTELEDDYQTLHPDLAPFFTRSEALAVVDDLRWALEQQTALYRLTDFHWLVLYSCLQMFCDLHNDDALGQGGKVGAYIVDRIELGYIADVFFFDTDFLFGTELIVAREHNLDLAPGVTPQATKIAAGLKPEPDDLKLMPIRPSESWSESAARTAVPIFGYIGPYPMREPDDSAVQDP